MQAVLHNKFTVHIGGVDYTHRVPFPIKWSQLLDEQLDEASLMLIRTKTKNIPPLTDVVITMWNEKDPSVTQTLNMLVASDKSDEIPAGSGRYNHEMYLIEQTKYLEGFLCRSQGYVNSLGRVFTGSSQLADYVLSVVPNVDDKLIVPDEQPTYITPLHAGENFTFKSVYDTFVTSRQYYLYRNPDNTLTADITMTVKYNGIKVWETENFQESYTTKLQNGVYSLKYVITASNQIEVYTIQYLFYAVENIDPLPKWNARTVIERALTIAETLREGDAPRFTLNAEQAAQFESIETPEFNFTQSTLREILQEVGRYVHGEPRLRGNVIYYDMYGSDEPTDVYYANYAAQSFQQTVERYATNLDSNVDNFVNALGYARGVIVEPYSGAYKTVQTETLYARITEDNMMISTKYPIRGISSVKCGLVNGSVPAADITSYVFESSEYNRLSSHNELYPDSKAYALYYTVGDRNIYGLGFKIPNVTNGAFAEYAIVNILRSATGTSVTPDDYPLLAFEVTYEPIFPARVQQSKSCILDLKKQRTIAYNQGQNVIETHYYGENMKGVIARLGNVDRPLTFVQRGLPSLPKIGTIYEDDYYVSAVAAEMHPTYTKVSIALSQDFNRYSDYVGISSTKRFYEVSKRQAYDSHIAYRDYVIIGDAAQNAGDALFDVTDLSEIFTQSGSMEPLSLLLAQGEDAGGNALPEIALPLNVAAMGNAALITTKYDDNYSAGNNSTYQSEGNVTGYFTNGVAYSDVHGNIEYLHLNYYTGGTVPTSQDQQNQIGLSLPDATYVDGVGKAYISTGSRPLWVKKGSTEIPSLPYQMDFVTNRRNIVVGSALAKNCPFVSGTQSGHGAVLYVLPKRLNKFRLTADLTGATQIKDYTGGSGITAANGTISFAPQTSSVSGQAWVMADKATGEVLIGCNRAITPEDEDILDKLTITAKHDIYV